MCAPPPRAPPPLAPPPTRSFFTGDVTLSALTPTHRIYRNAILLKLVRFSYAYVLSLYLCDYFSRKFLSKFEFPYLKARYVLIFHRKEFRRKSNGVVVEFLNYFRAQSSWNVVRDVLRRAARSLAALWVCFVTCMLNVPLSVHYVFPCQTNIFILNGCQFGRCVLILFVLTCVSFVGIVSDDSHYT